MRSRWTVRLVALGALLVWLAVSGIGGVSGWREAAEFLLLGCHSVQEPGKQRGAGSGAGSGAPSSGPASPEEKSPERGGWNVV